MHDLVGGKSATQNELIGDFEEEFGELAEGSAERPLAELAKGFASGCVHRLPSSRALYGIITLFSSLLASCYAFDPFSSSDF